MSPEEHTFGEKVLWAMPVLDAWAAEKTDFPDYDSGSDGPNAADELLARDGGRTWRPASILSEQET
jgi:glucose-6-phosphate 1-dehydrogenase